MVIDASFNLSCDLCLNLGRIGCLIVLTTHRVDRLLSQDVVVNSSGGGCKGQAGATAPLPQIFYFIFIILYLIFLKLYKFINFFKLFIFFKLNNIIFKINKN